MASGDLDAIDIVSMDTLCYVSHVPFSLMSHKTISDPRDTTHAVVASLPKVCPHRV